ncbi:MAG: L-threonylcarbamoyladenylate synthase [Candidatus Dormibacteraceae bacterium]
MEVLSPDAAGLRRAVELLRAGEVIAFPTDTVYGLAALASDRGALERVYLLKHRPRDRPLILMPPSVAQVGRWGVVDGAARRLISRWWPGPLTLVLVARPGVGPPLTAGVPPGIGVRIPNHQLALRLLDQAGEALATTSANLSGRTSALSAGEASALAGVAAVLDGGRAPGGTPSTVLELRGGVPRVLREGAIPSSALLPR